MGIIDYFGVLKRKIRHGLKAKDAHGLHSPFVYQLYNEVIRPKTVSDYSEFEPIETLRTQLLGEDGILQVTDYGAGAKRGEDGTYLKQPRRLSLIAKQSSKNKAWARLLARLVTYWKPQVVLELGTSLGISTAYQAEALRNYKPNFLSIEGCPTVAAVAASHLKGLGLDYVKISSGNLDECLVPELEQWLGNPRHPEKKIDYAFLDANHTYEATINYYHQLLPYCYHGTCLVFDDIHWSEGMSKAWKEISEDPHVTVSIDLYQLGLVFFRSGQAKEHFMLK